jgi:aminoglycoside 6'-N-acetyltransferase I
VKIRPIEVRDIVAWAAMRKELWPDADFAELSAETRQFVADPKKSILDAAFIAEDDDGRAIGFIELSVRAFSDGCDSMPVPHIEGWYVEPHARLAGVLPHGRTPGVGRKLMCAAKNWASEHRFTELASDTEVKNINSQLAHERCGFDEVDRIVKFRMQLPE